ncbi:MAG TPA: aminoacyl-tRNA hydrolase [Baekduia sp.]|uniref:aminoacyl-tRNA hydrolase n=1 Tax=Baekduia sp. TaxID=2600305 RepID=UPI002D77D181|nr:aminoacyl-tRNA hydrolase [Baekduia sp.]HET6510530.1 aminoacyl-tRNA hydrolase [Baekduia sp.]
MKLPGRSSGAPVDWLVVGLGNPGTQYARTPHNVGFLVAEALIARWGLGKPKKAFAGLYADGRTMPGGPRVGVLLPQTYMNESGRSAGPARGATRVALDHVVAVHDELDLRFGEIRTRLGGGLAGHNGLKSLKAGFGSPDFARVRIGIGRPDTTDPEIVAGYVLGRWRQPEAEVRDLVDRAADAVERIVDGRDALA